MKEEKLNLFDWDGVVSYYCAQLVDYVEEGKWDVVLQVVWDLATVCEMIRSLKVSEELKDRLKEKARKTIKQCAEIIRWKMAEDEDGE